MLPALIPSVQTQRRDMKSGAPQQAGFPRVTRPLHALSHLARGAGRVGVTSRRRAAPGRARAFVSEAFLPR